MSTVISAQQVKELRDRTGAGMMDCKQALTETGGDVEQAVANTDDETNDETKDDK